MKIEQDLLKFLACGHDQCDWIDVFASSAFFHIVVLIWYHLRNHKGQRTVYVSDGVLFKIMKDLDSA